MSRRMMAIMIVSGGLMVFAATADLSAGHRRAWRNWRNNGYYTVRLNRWCDQPVYQTDYYGPGTGNSYSYGYTTSPQPLVDSQPGQAYGNQRSTGQPQIGQPNDNTREPTVPPAPTIAQRPNDEGRTGRPSPLAAQDQSIPQTRESLRPNLDEAEPGQQVQQELEALQNDVRDLRNELEKYRSQEQSPEAGSNISDAPASN